MFIFFEIMVTHFFIVTLYDCVKNQISFFQLFHISGDATEYSRHLFRVLDTDNDNMVSWKEVMIGFHHLSPNGDPDQKLKLVYSVSAIDNNIFKYNCRLYVLFFLQMYDIKGDKAVTTDDVKT